MTILTVFSKFRNPKAFYRQEELWQLYMKVCNSNSAIGKMSLQFAVLCQLLTHRESEVQQLALACLMTYKPPFLLPYR